MNTAEDKIVYATHTTRGGATCRVEVVSVTDFGGVYRKAHVRRVDGEAQRRLYAVDADTLVYEDAA